MTEPCLTLIVAMDRNGLIGAAGGMPWHLPQDLRWFKQQTQGKAIVMGRRTFESLGRPLPRRRNFVITRNMNYHAAGVEVVDGLAMARQCAAGQAELVVIGGAEIYALALPEAAGLLITRIEKSYAGDTWFPPVDWSQWRIVADDPNPAQNGQPAYRFMTYERIGGYTRIK